jgi:hypothetical protein
LGGHGRCDRQPVVERKAVQRRLGETSNIQHRSARLRRLANLGTISRSTKIIPTLARSTSFRPGRSVSQARDFAMGRIALHPSKPFTYCKRRTRPSGLKSQEAITMMRGCRRKMPATRTNQGPADPLRNVSCQFPAPVLHRRWCALSTDTNRSPALNSGGR